MSRKEWGALAVVLVAVLGLQLVDPGGDQDPDDTRHVPATPEAAVSDPPESGADEGMFRTVTLEVTGMT